MRRPNSSSLCQAAHQQISHNVCPYIPRYSGSSTTRPAGWISIPRSLAQAVTCSLNTGTKGALAMLIANAEQRVEHHRIAHCRQQDYVPTVCSCVSAELGYEAVEPAH